MFFPVVEEIDIYDNRGVQQDDINSVFEYVAKKFSNEKQTQATDEDDDQPDYFQLVKTGSYDFFRLFDFELPVYPRAKKAYQTFYPTTIPFIPQEVASPPPDFLFSYHNCS